MREKLQEINNKLKLISSCINIKEINEEINSLKIFQQKTDFWADEETAKNNLTNLKKIKVVDSKKVNIVRYWKIDRRKVKK
jgi:hypothetical protein